MTHILTVCERGNVRSVTAAIVLKDLFLQDDVIPVGVMTTTPETLAMLAAWADMIYVVGDIRGIERLLLTPEQETKRHALAIGVDRWGQPMNPELVRMIVDAFLTLGWAGRPTRWEVADYHALNLSAYSRRLLGLEAHS